MLSNHKTATVIVWRFIETHFFGNTLGKAEAPPALAKHTHLMLAAILPA